MTDNGIPYPGVNLSLYRAAQVVMRLLAGQLIRRIEVTGIENVPAQGGFILATNHLNYLDSPIVFLSVPRMFYFLAGEKYARHLFFGPILRIGGAIFIDRGEADRDALRQALAALDDGHALGVAVEGTRSKTGGLIPGKTGAAYLATRSGAPIIPMVVWGTEQVFPTLGRLRRAVVQVRIGPPMQLPHGRARSAELDRLTDEIMVTLAAMLPEQYRGVYRDHPLLVKRQRRPSHSG